MRPNNYIQDNNNKFTNINKINNNNFENNNKNINNFYYNGDQYQIFVGYKGPKNKGNKSDYSKNIASNVKDNKNDLNEESINKKNIYTIGTKDLVTTITSNNKKIKRINPKAYLNESYEYLAHNIFYSF